MAKTSQQIKSNRSRLQKELMLMMKNQLKGITAFPSDGNLEKWICTIEGAKGTPYEEQTYKLQFDIPEDYPYKPPKVKFITSIYHPNIDYSGAICLDILNDSWSAIYNIESLLVSIQSLLGEPNNKSPLNGQAARDWSKAAKFKSEVLRVYSLATEMAIFNFLKYKPPTYTQESIDGDQDQIQKISTKYNSAYIIAIVFSFITLMLYIVAFSTPYWIQSYENTYTKFQNVGLWELCFRNYIHDKDSKQEIYDGCWQIFSRKMKYWKLRGWLLVDWLIIVEFLSILILVIHVFKALTVIIVSMHCCPIMNHERYQMQGNICALVMGFLSIIFSLIMLFLWAFKPDWNWIPRPDLNKPGASFVFCALSIVTTFIECMNSVLMIRNYFLIMKFSKNRLDLIKMSDFASAHLSQDILDERLIAESSPYMSRTNVSHYTNASRVSRTSRENVETFSPDNYNTFCNQFDEYEYKNSTSI
ncbi:hypothetical protein A3Q56_06474 [Intoshia linei]|uniref:UBC core domain-containing protein n=1 Tax=Intoshia linei TaxID=1819745 RepID=A0A177AUY9_9BILA|nr:hypothetical protein A3Q56_06474 [Intoshia linei]